MARSDERRHGGCGFETTDGPDPPRLAAERRAARRRTGLRFLAAAAATAAAAAAGFILLWPVALALGWFAASFLVAARTGYPGCPELGAIASVVQRREVRTRCTPLARRDARAARSTRAPPGDPG